MTMESYVEGYASENAALRRKLQSKTEAVLILSKDLNKCRFERDQFKLLAEDLENKLSNIKTNARNKGLHRAALYTDDEDGGFRPGVTIADMLREAQKRNKTLRMEMDDLKQQLCEAYEDMEALRSNYAQHRCGNMCKWEGQAFPNHPREELIQQLETMDAKCSQLQINQQALLDEREELLQERDTYKFKVHRLNYELSTIMKAKNNSIDIDALVTENRYLHERLLQTQEELNNTQKSLQKYKAAFDQSNKNVPPQGKNTALLSTTNRFISQGQVRELLEAVAYPMKSNTPSFMENLRNVCQALFDSLEEKNLRLAHQKKANRILAKRIVDLESLAAECGSPVFPSISLLDGYNAADAVENIEEPEKENISPVKIEKPKTIQSPNQKGLNQCSMDIKPEPKKNMLWRNSSSDECQPLPPSVQLMVEQALGELRREASHLSVQHEKVPFNTKDNL